MKVGCNFVCSVCVAVFDSFRGGRRVRRQGDVTDALCGRLPALEPCMSAAADGGGVPRGHACDLVRSWQRVLARVCMQGACVWAGWNV